MSQWGYTIVQGVVTVALLVTAFMLRDNPHIPDLIIGAVISTWLREGIYVGQAVGRSSSPTMQVPVQVMPLAATLHPGDEATHNPPTVSGSGTGA